MGYKLLTSIILAASAAFAQCPSVDANGWCVTGVSAIQNNLLGPLTPTGTSPWPYSDLAETGTAGYFAPQAIAEAPALGTVLAGTFSFSGGNTLNTTADLRTALSGVVWIAIAWNTVDGAGTGRLLFPIDHVTATTVVGQENAFTPSFSGATGYIMSTTPDANGCTFACWTSGNPNTVWNYYDVAIALYRLYYRTNNATYLTQARQFADIQWQWVIDHGYSPVNPRAAAMISQFFRVGEGHTERLPGLYNYISVIVPIWANNGDLREAGYALWDVALGAKVDTDPTRHAQYCSWLTTYTPRWTSTQNADGSWSENEYGLNPSFVSAPKSFTAPFQYQGAPWRQAINVKSLEAAYESLADTTSQGCNNPTMAATVLTAISNAVAWQWNYGRDTSNRGVYYEVNSQSNDQLTHYPAEGTLAATLTSTAVVGTSTTFVDDAICDGTHFIGIQNPRTVYMVASCADNTHLTLANAFGLYGEASNETASPWAWAPAASTSCHSSATQCNTGSGDRNLTRTIPGGVGWLYAKTLNPSYKTWGDEFFSGTLGGPTAGLTSAANLGSFVLPCSGPACDGLVTDTVASAESCITSGNVPPCLFGVSFGNLGKNYGEAFGAPGIDNELAWRLLGGSPPPPAPTCSPATGVSPPTATDVQLQTNMALGVVSCTNSILQNGSCGVADVQRVINAALGQGCKIGP